LLTEALRRAQEERFLYAERETQRLAGEVTFARNDLAQAQEAWQAAYVTAQREGIPLGPYLADLARVHAARREEAQAKALLTEAVTLGGRNVALAAVEVYTALGQPEEARQYVDAAYREAWADGPPYAFHYELQRIRAALNTLGLPEPQLPPFDPADVSPLPDEAEIRAFIAELNQGKTIPSQDGLLALTPEWEPSSAAEATTRAEQQGKRPWWKFWSQN
jgi:tetratricopeptide (TPR) repeat protein